MIKMGKSGAGIGGSIGGLIGFVIGSMIPSEGDIAMSFFGRVLGGTITNDPTGFIISGVYAMIGIAICGAIGAFVGGLTDRIG